MRRFAVDDVTAVLVLFLAMIFAVADQSNCRGGFLTGAREASRGEQDTTAQE